MCEASTLAFGLSSQAADLACGVSSVNKTLEVFSKRNSNPQNDNVGLDHAMVDH